MAKLKYINPTKWINEHMGKIYDIDGAYGIQCVDLYKIFLKEIGYPNPTRAIGGNGWAESIWYNRDALGLSEYFDYIVGELQVGDIVLWGRGSRECPDSHVAMYAGDDDGNRGIFFGSNQGTAHSPGNLLSISCEGTLGALRYKGFTKGEEMHEIVQIQPGAKGAVYRVYNPDKGDHMFTASLNEAQSLVNSGWKYEGIAFYGK